MQAFMTAKVRPFLVISSVLAAWILLAAQPAQAHDRSLPAPICDTVPTSETFFTATETTNVVSAAAGFTASSQNTKQGGGVTGRGDRKYRYAKITVPALAAGELRVFDTTSGLSDAVLCRDRAPIANSITSYGAHNAAQTAARAAETAAVAANRIIVFNDTNDDTDGDGEDDLVVGNDNREGGPRTKDTAPAIDTVSNATAVLNRVRGGLNAARIALGAAARALNTAANANPEDAVAIEGYANSVATFEQTALAVHSNNHDAATNAGTVPADPTVLGNVTTALSNGLTALGTARDNLRTARDYLSRYLNPSATDTSAVELAHTGFQIRAAVSPGDEEYILVVAPEDPAATGGLDFAIRFHGAIDSTSDATTPPAPRKSRPH